MRLMKKIAIYLAGSIQKGHETNTSFWLEKDLLPIQQHLPEFEISFLNPALRSDDLSDQQSVFGRDMVQVFCSNFVFVDARERRGLGVGAEMMWAKVNRIPVIAWAPQNTHYHQKDTSILGVPVADFIHPFVDSLSDKLVETVIEGAEWIRTITSNPSISIKGLESIESAMHYYKEKQFHLDGPMQEMMRLNELLKKRLENLRVSK
jgi:hypothetical protein